MGDVPQNKGMLDNVGDNITSAVENTTDLVTNNKIVKDTSSLLSNTASSISGTVTNAVSNISVESVQDTKNAIMETLNDNTSVLFLMISIAKKNGKKNITGSQIKIAIDRKNNL